MIRHKIGALAAFAFCLALSSCGGNGGSSSQSSLDPGAGDGGGGNTTPTVPTVWRDLSLMFNCGVGTSGASYSFGVSYQKFSQAITVNQSKVGAVITGIFYPSGQTVALYDDDGNGFPGTRLATASTSNYYDRNDGNGSACCDDRTFVSYFEHFVPTTAGTAYHVVVTPTNPAQYTSIKVAYMPSSNSCYTNQPMKCQRTDDGTWEACNIPGGQFSSMIQDILY